VLVVVRDRDRDRELYTIIPLFGSFYTWRNNHARNKKEEARGKEMKKKNKVQGKKEVAVCRLYSHSEVKCPQEKSKS
jgi:hypothetical protein